MQLIIISFNNLDKKTRDWYAFYMIVPVIVLHLNKIWYKFWSLPSPERYIWYINMTSKKISISFFSEFLGSYFHLKDKLINHPLQHFLSNERKFQINFFPEGECFLPQKPWYQGQFPSQNILQNLLAPAKTANTHRNSWSTLLFIQLSVKTQNWETNPMNW